MIPGAARTHSALLAAGGGGEEALPTLVVDIGWALLLSGVLAVVFTRLRIPTVAAFLVAGVVAGPLGTEVVTDPASIDTIANLGLIFLLFMIGLEVDLRALLSSGRPLVLTGLLQYPLTALFGFLVVQGLLLVGVGTDLFGEGYAPLYAGLALAASSTLLVVKLFQQTFTMDTQVGRVALALLIFQDLWAIVVLAIQPNLDNPQAGVIVASFVGIFALGLAAVVVSRTVIPLGFRWIAKLPEIILLASIAWCFAVVLAGMNIDAVTEALFGVDLGLSVSPSMGALIAGATIASLPYSTEITSKVGVVRDFFVTLFFVGLGMGIPAPDGVSVLILALVLAVLAVVARYVVMLPLLYVTGLDRRTASVASTRLAQISEFSLVIVFLGVELGHVGELLNSSVIFAFVLTALITPWLFQQADPIADKLAPWLSRVGIRGPEEAAPADDAPVELALLGVHRTASSMLFEMSERSPELLARTVVIDFNVDIHDRIAETGVDVHYGDLGNTDALIHAGVDRARVVLCTIPDDVLVATSNGRLVRSVRAINTEAVVIATATSFTQVRELYEAGADYVLLPRLDAADSALEAVLQALGGRIADYREATLLRVAPETRREVLE